MVANTVEANRNRHGPELGDELWLFGYGSLIFKADFPFTERLPASIQGWSRRFWQGSHDHRGTADAPGRVVTLVEDPGATCHGMAYRVAGDTLSHLDMREKNGYLRFITPLSFESGGTAPGLVYIATRDNAAWLGPASMAQMAAHIHQSAGPSGPNRDYLLALAAALREMAVEDDHVHALEAELLKRMTP